MKNINFILLLIVQLILVTSLYFSLNYDLSLRSFFNFREGWHKQLTSLFVGLGPVIGSFILAYYSVKKKK